MIVLQRAWSAWLSFLDRPFPSWPLVWAKRGVCACLVIDLLAIVVFGAWSGVLYEAVHGGLIRQPKSWEMLHHVFQDAAWIGPFWWSASLVLLGSVALGVGGRWPLILGIVAYAQLGHFDWPGDRGIDRISRTVLLILAFSDVGRAKVPATVSAWPAHLLRLLLVLIYVDAGIAKLDSKPSWFTLGAFNPLYGIMAAPQVGRLSADFFHPYMPVFTFFASGTVILEFTSPVLLFPKIGKYWAIFGAALHVGLAITMNLGIFPYAMLALYPLLLLPWFSGSAGSSSRSGSGTSAMASMRPRAPSAEGSRT